MLPLPFDLPMSASGATLAVAAAIGWMLAAFAPNAMIVRIGAGALMGLPGTARGVGDAMAAESFSAGGEPGSGRSAGRSRRDLLLFALWAVTTLAACTLLTLGDIIDWWPLV